MNLDIDSTLQVFGSGGSWLYGPAEKSGLFHSLADREEGTFRHGISSGPSLLIS